MVSGDYALSLSRFPLSQSNPDRETGNPILLATLWLETRYSGYEVFKPAAKNSVLTMSQWETREG